MNIEWRIKKKQGNFRPTLSYSIFLEEHEIALAVEPLIIISSLPVIPDESRSWCLPGKDERSEEWIPAEFHRLSVPWFRVGQDSGFLRLPFRESGEYPEVEESFKQLRDEYEKIVCEAYKWESIQEKGSLHTTDKTREQIAGTIAAKKMLDLFGD